MGRHSPMLSVQHENLCRAYETIIRHCGENVDRQGLLKTPERAARAMLFFTKGYEDNLDSKLNSASKIFATDLPGVSIPTLQFELKFFTFNSLTSLKSLGWVFGSQTLKSDPTVS